ncbi:MAG: nitroreductase family protein [Desulfocapsaceae bacterium]|nr:nitroreductase family protein [Desulfocapsaceae bacterium]
MMDFSELMQARQSVRSYTNEPVEEWKIERLIEAVRLAPSASNSQPWKLIIVNDPEKKDRVARATYSTLVSFNRFASQAPLLAVLAIERPKVITQIGATLKDREFPLIDIGIAASQFCLQAAALNLGTCMLGWFDEKAIRDILGIPQKVRIGLVLTVGYSDEPPRKKIRKKKEQMSAFNNYF